MKPAGTWKFTRFNIGRIYNLWHNIIEGGDKMFKRKSWLFVIVLLLVLPSFISTTSLTSIVARSRNIDSPFIQTKEHQVSEDPTIAITNDDDFATMGFAGDGSPGNPYRIENFNITGDSTELISIQDTRKNFIIQNCTLHQSGFGNEAILLYNVSNGEIFDNAIYDNWESIFLNNCTDITVQANNITSSQYGIGLQDCYNIEVLNNNIDCIGYCINQNYGGDIIVKHNILNGSDFNLYMNEIDTGWFENNTSTHSSLGMYFEGPNLVIKNNNLANNTRGMSMALCDYALVFNNTIDECGGGLLVEGGIYQTIANNTIANGSTGIDIDRPDDCLFENNTISGNDFGVLVVADSDRNWFVGNFFDGNTLNAEDNGTDTFFGTNYWSDYIGSDGNGDGIGDTPYPISGTANNEDPHPLMTPSTHRYSTIWAPAPTDQHLELGYAFRYDLNCTAPEPIYWWLSGAYASWFSVDSNGVITNATVFVMEYNLPLTVWARNIYSFTISATFRIDINDTLIPTWDEEPIDQFHEFGQAFSYDLNASDAWDIDRYWTNATTYFSMNSNTGVLYAANPPVGIYGIEVRAYDPEDKYVSAVFTVTVADTIPPSINHPEDLEFMEGADASGAIGWMAIDASPMTYEIFENGVGIQDGVVPIGNMIYLNYAIMGMAPGTYNYTIVVTDGYHITTDTVMLVITPAGTTPPPTTTTPPPPPPIDITLILVVGVGGVVIVIAIIIVLRKRSQ
jgi:parallel beta-helix repeat protein